MRQGGPSWSAVAGGQNPHPGPVTMTTYISRYIAQVFTYGMTSSLHHTYTCDMTSPLHHTYTCAMTSSLRHTYTCAMTSSLHHTYTCGMTSSLHQTYTCGMTSLHHTYLIEHLPSFIGQALSQHVVTELLPRL